MQYVAIIGIPLLIASVIRGTQRRSIRGVLLALMLYIGAFLAIRYAHVRWFNPISSIYFIALAYSLPLLGINFLLKRHFGWYAIGLAIVLSITAHLNTYHVAVRYESIGSLVPKWAGKNIVVITDLHSSPVYDRHWLNRLRDQINSLKPDAVLLLGDSVNEFSCEELLQSDFRFSVPAYAVIGNHDNARTNHALHLKGWKVLEGTSVMLFGQRLVGLPMRDFRTKVEPSDVVMTHYQQKAAVRGKLMLMGHSHGGQVWPAQYVLGLLNPFMSGWYTVGQTMVYSHTGTGSSLIRGRLGTENQILVLR